MKKNVASQAIGIQMITAADGSAFTSAVTVKVTGDNGTQATGLVGSGACTHKGGGFHTYAPAQAETNYDHIGFTFSGSGAISATVQLYTDFPQSGDAFGLVGATGSGLTSLASASNLATVAGYIDTEVAAIKTKTDFLPSATAGAAGGVFIAGSNAATTANLTGNITGNVTGSVGSVTDRTGFSLSAAGVQAIWDALESALTVVGSIGKKLVTWLGAPYVDTYTGNTKQTGDAFARLGAPAGASVSADIADLPTNAELATSQASSDDATLAAIAALNNLSAAQVNAEADTAILDAGLATATNLAAVKTVADAILDDTGTSGVVLRTADRGGIRKNTALANFEILMTDATNHNPTTGKAVSVTRSIDGGAFSAGTLGAVTELSNGIYKFSFGAADLNGNVITLRAVATGADDLFITIWTSP
jgi:hypothetical protein